jgi:hypothetical protein
VILIDQIADTLLASKNEYPTLQQMAAAYSDVSGLVS